MPSLRKRVSSYFRQLSFYNEPREKKHNINENSFITKYLEGHINIKEGPPILYGKNPTDLPNYDLGSYNVGPDTIVGCYSGPNGGLTTVKRLEKHLSVPDTDIDFIDTQDEIEVSASSPAIQKSPVSQQYTQTVDNTTMVIKVAGQEYLVTNRKKNDNNKSQSLGSLSDFEIEIEKTKICTDNNNSTDVKCKNQEQNDNQNNSDSKNQNATTSSGNVINNNKTKPVVVGQKSTKSESAAKQFSKTATTTTSSSSDTSSSKVNSYSLAKSKSEGNPFQHKKKGKIIRISNRPTAAYGNCKWNVHEV